MGPEEEFERFDSENSWMSVFQVWWIGGLQHWEGTCGLVLC